MDGWKGNRKFWARGSVFATVDLIWVTLCYRKLAEELGDPPPPITGGQDGRDWHMYTFKTHSRTNPASKSKT